MTQFEQFKFLLRDVLIAIHQCSYGNVFSLNYERGTRVSLTRNSENFLTVKIVLQERHVNIINITKFLARNYYEYSSITVRDSHVIVRLSLRSGSISIDSNLNNILLCIIGITQKNTNNPENKKIEKYLITPETIVNECWTYNYNIESQFPFYNISK